MYVYHSHVNIKTDSTFPTFIGFPSFSDFSFEIDFTRVTVTILCHNPVSQSCVKSKLLICELEVRALLYRLFVTLGLVK